MEFLQIKENKKEYLNLILKADPDINVVNNYLNSSDMYAIVEDKHVVSEIIITQVDNDTCELKNISTLDNYKGRGYASKLIQYVFNIYKSKYKKMIVGTTENMIPFYVINGFTKYHHTIKNFFTDNYSEEIWDGNLHCIDIYYYCKNLQDNNFYWNRTIPELSVTNLDKSLKFYKTAGFKIEYDRPENKFAFISLDQIQFMLQEISNNDKWSVAPLAYPFGNGINFQLEVDNLDEIYKKIKDANYKIAFDIEENWYRQDNKMLGNKEFLVQDPDGYLLRFFVDLGEK